MAARWTAPRVLAACVLVTLAGGVVFGAACRAWLGRDGRVEVRGDWRGQWLGRKLR